MENIVFINDIPKRYLTYVNGYESSKAVELYPESLKQMCKDLYYTIHEDYIMHDYAFGRDYKSICSLYKSLVRSYCKACKFIVLQKGIMK